MFFIRCFLLLVDEQISKWGFLFLNDLQVLKNSNKGEPVSRLLWTSAKETILACYHVGIYSDKELIGQGMVLPDRSSIRH
jgi:hypothetical protein